MYVCVCNKRFLKYLQIKNFIIVITSHDLFCRGQDLVIKCVCDDETLLLVQPLKIHDFVLFKYLFSSTCVFNKHCCEGDRVFVSHMLVVTKHYFCHRISCAILYIYQYMCFLGYYLNLHSLVILASVFKKMLYDKVFFFY